MNASFFCAYFLPPLFFYILTYLRWLCLIYTGEPLTALPLTKVLSPSF